MTQTGQDLQPLVGLLLLAAPAVILAWCVAELIIRGYHRRRNQAKARRVEAWAAAARQGRRTV